MAENQQASFKYKNSLPEAVKEKIKPTFIALSYPTMLRKCLHGKTQNVNESLKNFLWSRIPKSTFVQRRTLEFGVFEAISRFNDGNITKCRLLQMVGIEPGLRTISTMKTFDETRVQKAEIAISDYERAARRQTKLRKRRLELQHEGNRDYEAGMH